VYTFREKSEGSTSVSVRVEQRDIVLKEKKKEGGFERSRVSFWPAVVSERPTTYKSSEVEYGIHCDVEYIATKCTKPKREKGACYTCSKMGHQIKECSEREKRKTKSPANRYSMWQRRYQRM